MHLRGIDILLHDGDAVQTVRNVLVGEPQSVDFCDTTAMAFTIAIPKGDINRWTDRTVEFFGGVYRTIGQSERGIEALMPLAWHLKVRVQQQITNGAVTIYESKTYARHDTSLAYHYDARGTTADKTGEQTADAVSVYLYQPEYIPKVGDIIVIGGTDFVFNITSPQALSASMAVFRAQHPKHAIIRDVRRISVGTVPDIEISAR